MFSKRAATLLLLLGTISSTVSAKKPNILFLFNDDQDLHLGSLDYLPVITEKVQKQGVSFNNHYATIAICCPSRVALLRGQHAHNTNITFVTAPGGAYDKLQLSGQDRNWLPHWFKRAGYHSEYIGKLLNGYHYKNFHEVPKGWDHFDGLLDPYTYVYNTPVFSANGETPKYYEGSHQSDVLRAKAADRLKKLIAGKAGNGDNPWFLTVAAVAPHQQFDAAGMWPPVPASRHSHLYPTLKAPRTPNFNPLNHRKPSWIGELPLMDQAAIDFADATYRARSQALTTLNEMYEELFQILEDTGELENTYIVFSSDHGYHTGQHRSPAGKLLPYREDTQIPFLIRGPGIPANSHTNLPSSHVDVAPTLLTLAGLPASQHPAHFDGRDLSPYWHPSPAVRAAALTPAPEAINIEFWGGGSSERGPNRGKSVVSGWDPRNTYKTVRIVGEGYSYLYNHFCTNETELYNTVSDPYELSPVDLAQHVQLHNRLNALLLVSKSCASESCRNPWRTLHPNGHVNNLKEALDATYDAYYTSFPKVAFKECLNYQLVENEAPFWPVGVEVEGLGRAGRDKEASDGLFVSETAPFVIEDNGRWGDVYDGFEAIEERARELTARELGVEEEEAVKARELGVEAAVKTELR